MKATVTTLAAAIITLSLVYVVNAKGDLHSLKPQEWAAVQKNPTELSKFPTIKHNPTNVHGKGMERLSCEERRPLFIEVIEGKKITFNETTTTPMPAVKVRVAGEKKVKAKVEGPQTIYVIDEQDNLHSLNQEELKAAQENIETLATTKTLKHNPTCVEKSILVGGRISTEDENRPMYWVKAGKLVRVWSSPDAEKAAAPAAPAAKVSTKASSKKTKVEVAAPAAEEVTA